MVLLVAEENVVEKRTIRREEGACDFKGLRVPEFALFHFLLGVQAGILSILYLGDEPQLS